MVERQKMANFAVEMKKTRITTYDPTLSIEENAIKNGVKPSTMYHYLKKNGYDRTYDLRIQQYRRIWKYHKENPKAKAPQIALELGLTANTVRKYLKMEEPQPQEKKISAIKQSEELRFLSVDDNQFDILKTILKIHCKGSETFQCDLTAWTCGFYHHGIKRPTWLFDKYPQNSNILPLSEIDQWISDGTFFSVVIDLPTTVRDPNSRKDLDVSSAFLSMEELYAENKKMLTLAYRLMQTDGILVFKTMDFTYQNNPQWISDYAIATAQKIGFVLIDKYIYLDSKYNKTDKRRTKYTASVPAHAYFFVFRKQVHH